MIANYIVSACNAMKDLLKSKKRLTRAKELQKSQHLGDGKKKTMRMSCMYLLAWQSHYTIILDLLPRIKYALICFS